MAFKMKISSRSGNTRKQISKILESGEEGAQQGMNRLSSQVKQLSQQLVPRDTGKLHNSAYAIGKDGYSDIDGGDASFVSNRQAQLSAKKGPQAEVGYSADYALFVHEDLQANHPVGQAKFLEAAVRRLKNSVVKDTAKSMSNGMKKV